MRRYSTASSKTSAGVFISRSKGRTAATPSSVNSRLITKVEAMVVCTAVCSFFMSRAPKLRPMTTPAPTEKPLKKKTIMFTMGVVEPTAASACLLTKFPTMIESTVLYSIWNTLPSISGSAKRTRCRRIGPLVMSLAVVFLSVLRLI